MVFEMANYDRKESASRSSSLRMKSSREAFAIALDRLMQICSADAVQLFAKSASGKTRVPGAK
jgi:hypothetical protein